MQAIATSLELPHRTVRGMIETMPDPLPKPPGRPPAEPIIIRTPSRLPQAPEVDGSLDEEEEIPEIRRRPEIVPEMPPPPAPEDRVDCPSARFRLRGDGSG